MKAISLYLIDMNGSGLDKHRCPMEYRLLSRKRDMRTRFCRRWEGYRLLCDMDTVLSIAKDSGMMVKEISEQESIFTYSSECRFHDRLIAPDYRTAYAFYKAVISYINVADRD